MDTKIKIFIILGLILLLVGTIILVYFFLIKKKPSSSLPSSPQSLPPSLPSINNTPKDAICSSNGVVINGISEEDLSRENKDENYNFSLSKLGRDIKTSIERFMFPERFTLSQPVVTDKNLLENDKYYVIGTIKQGSQITTKTPSINGGKNCLQFPNTIYKEAGNCPTDKTRDVSGVCKWNSCPTDQVRDANGVCQCIYEKYTSKDIPGNDIKCIRNPSDFETCKIECNNDPNCKAYNIIYQGGAWGQDWGCCLKNTSSIPTNDSNKIDYFKKIEGTPIKDKNGLCKSPCPADKTRDINGVCQWNPCPTDKTRDINGVCQWNPCPTDKTRDVNGVCQWNPCPINSTVDSSNGNCNCNPGYSKAPGKAGRNEPCYSNCPINSTMDSNGNCNCNPGYSKAPGKAGRNEPCYYNCNPNTSSMDINGNCVCNPGYVKSGDGQCNKACGINENMNFYGACNCNDGFTRAGDGTCYKRCPANAIMNYNGTCNCIVQHQKQPDGTCKYIQCKSDEYWDGTKCKSTNCGLGGYLDTSGSAWFCRCGPGYSLDFNGVCQPIPSYGSARKVYDQLAFNNFLMNSGMG